MCETNSSEGINTQKIGPGCCWKLGPSANSSCTTQLVVSDQHSIKDFSAKSRQIGGREVTVPHTWASLASLPTCHVSATSRTWTVHESWPTRMWHSAACLARPPSFSTEPQEVSGTKHILLLARKFLASSVPLELSTLLSTVFAPQTHSAKSASCCTATVPATEPGRITNTHLKNPQPSNDLALCVACIASRTSRPWLGRARRELGTLQKAAALASGQTRSGTMTASLPCPMTSKSVSREGSSTSSFAGLAKCVICTGRSLNISFQPPDHVSALPQTAAHLSDCVHPNFTMPGKSHGWKPKCCSLTAASPQPRHVCEATRATTCWAAANHCCLQHPTMPPSRIACCAMACKVRGAALAAWLIAPLIEN